MFGFEVTVKPLPRANAYLVRIAGSIDMQTAPELQNACRRLIATGRERLLLEFSRVEYINSQGLGVLLALQKQLGPAGGGLAIAGAGERVRRVIVATGIHKVLNLYPDDRQALETDALFKKG